MNKPLDPKPLVKMGRRYPENELPYEALFGDALITFSPRSQFRQDVTAYGFDS